MTIKDKPWTKSYKLGPYKLAKTKEPYPKIPLYKFLDDTVAKYPKQNAILYSGKTITYKELGLYVDKLATALTELGVKKGDKVATIIPTCPQFIISAYAIYKTGGVHVPCSLLHKGPDLEYEIGDSGAETIICLNDSLELVNSIKDKTKLKTIIITSLKDYSSEEPEEKKIAGVYQFLDLIEQSKPMPPEVDINPMEDLAELAFTGGSTGIAKGVMLTHYNVTTNAFQSLDWILGPIKEGIIGKSSILIAIASFHIYGHWNVREAIHWGLQMILIPDPRDTHKIVQMIKKFRPLLCTLVPTQIMRLIPAGIGRTTTCFISGAAPLPPEVQKKFKKITGMPITEGYGLTETGPATHFNLSTFAKITGFMPFEKMASVGVPVVDTDVKLVNIETGKEITSFEEEGEIYIRGPQVMAGYWPIRGSGLKDGWLPTGDIAKIDKDGYFYIVDRVKDMINVSGYKVYSRNVDDTLFEHPAVLGAVAIGLPDPERPGSERIKAFITLKEDHKGKTTADEIITYLKEKLPPYAIPKFIEFRDDLPLTVTDKFFKRQLREEEINRLKKSKT